ncbi:MAG TPA: hypothetical protein VJU86_10860 [Pyrinomonadaceae bacterium]|nr:hypothetical protein [Pyrinomonadaceae bacterium]
MPNSPQKTTKRKRSTLKKLSVTTKEVTRKKMKGIKGKGLAPSSQGVLIGAAAPAVTVGVAPQLTVGVAPQPLIDPKFTVTK